MNVDSAAWHSRTRGPVDLYRSKAVFVRMLEPVVAVLQARRVSPDAVTLAAVPVGLLGGACLLASPGVPLALLAIPFLAGLRLVLNLLDGELARRTGRTHPRGEFYNELGDRLADIALLAPVAFLPGADRGLVLLGVLAAVLASFASVATRAAGGPRSYRGLLSKPGRMVLLGVFAIAAFALGSGAWGVFGPILLVGASLTLVERVLVAVRTLE